MSSQPSGKPCFCVSVHDVAAPTWEACERLMASIPELAECSLTLLIVPDWHGQGVSDKRASRRFDRAISSLYAQGHELCLHGYTHDDPSRAGWLDWWQRRVLSRSEAEFAALDESAARERLHRGREWLSLRGWSARGFVPPAWMINRPGVDAVRKAGFDYLGLYRGWMCLTEGKHIAAPCLTYTVRHPLGDALWRSLQERIAERKQHCPVWRLALHPADLQRPDNLRHARRQINRWLRNRITVTEHQAYADLISYPIRNE